MSRQQIANQQRRYITMKVDYTQNITREKVKAAVLASAIAAGVMISFFILFTFVFPGVNIPNWLTMAVEIAAGISIAIFLFKLQGITDYIVNQTIKKIDKTDDSINQTITKIDQYHENIRVPSLKRIDSFLSMAWNSIGIDKDRMGSMEEETQRLNFVKNLLQRDYKESAFKILRYVVDQLQIESHVAKSYMDEELQHLLAKIIENIHILYGLSPKLQQVAGVENVDKWKRTCEDTLRQMEKAQKRIQEKL